MENKTRVKLRVKVGLATEMKKSGLVMSHNVDWQTRTKKDQSAQLHVDGGLATGTHRVT